MGEGGGFVKARARHVDQAVHASAQKAAGKGKVTVGEFFQDPGLRDVVGGQRIVLRFQGFLLPEGIALYPGLFAAQKIESVLQGRVPWFHAESRGAGAVNGSGVAERGQQMGEVGVVGVAHVPFRRGRSQGVEIQIFQDFAHEFPASAGDQAVVLIA